jgi:hypothetical protein
MFNGPIGQRRIFMEIVKNLNQIRKRLLDAVKSNGGYSQSRREGSFLAFTVGLYYADLSFHSVRQAYIKNLNGAAPGVAFDDPFWMKLEANWDKDRTQSSLWSTIQEDMYRGLNDDDGNRTYSPATATRHGLTYYTAKPAHARYARRTGKEVCCYPASKPNWIRVDPYVCEYFDVTFALYGRGGKHLCVTQFEGVPLDSSDYSFEDKLRASPGDDAYVPRMTNLWCRKLLAMIEEWDVCFTEKNASAEMDCLAVYRMEQRVEEEAEEREAEEKRIASYEPWFQVSQQQLNASLLSAAH